MTLHFSTAVILCLVNNSWRAAAGSIEVLNAIKEEFGIELPASTVFDYPTVTAMADHLSWHVGNNLVRRQHVPAAAVGSDAQHSLHEGASEIVGWSSASPLCKACACMCQIW